MSWTNHIVFFDCEVFKNDWLFCFEFNDTGKRFEFHNNNDGLKAFYETYKDYIFCGHNVKGYDQYILRAIVQENASTTFVKEVNDWIISGEQGWQYPNFSSRFSMNLCDTINDIVPRKSLKELEFNMGINIKESDVPFDLPRKLTTEELQDVKYYCWNDVEAVRHLFFNRMDYFEPKVTLCTMKGIHLGTGLKMTNAQLVAKFLNCQKQDYSSDAYQYEFPIELDQHYLTNEMKDFFLNRLRPTGDENIDEFRTPKLDLEIAGVPHTLGIGGIHGALPLYHAQSDKDYIIVGSDVASYYPALAINFGLLSRALDLPLYRQIRDDRIEFKRLAKEAKKIGDDGAFTKYNNMANAYKLILNTSYGISLSKFSDAFDMKGGRSICINGQVFLIMMIGMLQEHISSFELIQSNTDGIVFKVLRNQLDNAIEVMDNWCSITGLELEHDYMKSIHQRDVNNYMYVGEDGSIKAKGGVLSQYKGGNWKVKNMPILDKALVNYFKDGTPIEDTIQNEGDIIQFQILGRSGSTYDATVLAMPRDVKNLDVIKNFLDGDHSVITPIQKYNRMYAASGIGQKMFKFKNVPVKYIDDVPHTQLKTGKWKPTKKNVVNGHIQKFDTVSNCPDNILLDNEGTNVTIDDIDLNFYIKLTYDRLSKFYE